MSEPENRNEVPKDSIAKRGNFIRSGAIAGTVSSFGFLIVHQLTISNIWSSWIIMLVAGALCGLCLGWTYDRLVAVNSFGSWLRYNATFVLMFGLLGAVSVLAYDPITTVAVLIDNNEPPDELIGKALPMTVIFTIFAAVAINLLFGRGWSQFWVVLLTCVLLVLTLGLNVSIVGFVAFPSGSLYLIIELFALILALGLAFAVVFIALEREQLNRR